jgi:hypothetical protein
MKQGPFRNALLRALLVLSVGAGGIACGPKPPAPEIDCADGIDNDADGTTDCADTDCAAVAGCEILENEIGKCADGFDNDADGLSDCADLTDCANDDDCIDDNETGKCSDGADNDQDGVRDCDDPDCAQLVNPNDPTQGCTPETDPVCLDRAPCAILDCANDPTLVTQDNDCDALSDSFECITTFGNPPATLNANDPDSDNDGLPDGVEAGAIAGVDAACGNTLFDTNSATRTNPLDADSDNDGRLDGCEDRNKDGNKQANELDPNDADTDGDGLPDNQEDANNNCQIDAGETDGTKADTDSDGINDGVEVGAGGNANNADTDGDGLSDGVEDTNHNGQVDPGETNPTVADSDGDGISDGTEDTNQNGTVDVGETDPADVDFDNDGVCDGSTAIANVCVAGPDSFPGVNDTDGDGIPDNIEDAIGTDPNDADSDNDGLSDGEEIAAGGICADGTACTVDSQCVGIGNGLCVGGDPLDANDADPGVAAVCAIVNLKPVQFQDDAAGDWAVALETDYTYLANITAANGNRAATFNVSNADSRVAGFVVNLPLQGGGTSFAQGQALITNINNRSGQIGSTPAVQSNGTTSVSHDGFDTLVSAQVNFSGGLLDLGLIRNNILEAITNQNAGAYTGLPGAVGVVATTYTLKFSAQIRSDINRLIIFGAITDKTRFDNTALLDAIEVEDIGNGSALSKAFSGNTNACDLFNVNALPAADFIWMADISGSTDNDRDTIVAASTVVFDALQNNGVDFRMGVVPHSENDRTQGAGNGGDMRSGFLDPTVLGVAAAKTQFENDLRNVNGTDGCEFGLIASDDAIDKALPRTAPGIRNALKIRDAVKLVVFYVSDETAQEVEINSCGQGNIGTGQAEGAPTLPPNAAQQTTINNIVAPFISKIQANEGIAFGQLTPLQAPFCAGNAESGEGYAEVVTALGGTFYNVCDADPGATLQNIIDIVTGAASEFILQDGPISSTIKVGLQRQGSTTITVVPRSLSDGFDFASQANTIFFRGTTFRPNIGDKVTVSYRLWEAPVPPVVCNLPLVLNPVTNSCECPADCGLGANLPVGFICDTDPAVCAAACAPDCNGICEGNTICNTTTCGCDCPDTTPGDGVNDCAGTVTPGSGFVCDVASCQPVCADTTPGDGAADCGGTCAGNINTECDANSCGCVCGDGNNDGTVDCNNACVGGTFCDPNTCECKDIE